MNSSHLRWWLFLFCKTPQATRLRRTVICTQRWASVQPSALDPLPSPESPVPSERPALGHCCLRQCRHGPFQSSPHSYVASVRSDCCANAWRRSPDEHLPEHLSGCIVDHVAIRGEGPATAIVRANASTDQLRANRAFSCFRLLLCIK
jgi:hypothetical protein